MHNSYCGWQEEPAILISRLFLCVHGTYVATASFRLPLRMNGMHRTKKRNLTTHVFGPPITCNLIFCVSTIHHMKLMQRTASNYWNKSILTFNVVVLYMPLLLWLLRLLLLLWQYMCMGVIYRASNLSRGRGAAKFRKIHKNTQNTPKFGRNLIKYMHVCTAILKLDSATGGIYLL